MTPGDALLRAIIDSPADDTPRLVCADWLDENGDPARAEFIRVLGAADRPGAAPVPRPSRRAFSHCPVRRRQEMLFRLQRLYHLDLGRMGYGRRCPPEAFRAYAGSAWADLGSADARQGFRALRALAAALEPAVALLRDKLSSTPQADLKRLARLLEELDDDRFAVRERATEELERLGCEAEPALHKKLAERPSAEARRRIAAILTQLEQRAVSGNSLRLLRGLEALVGIGTPEARQALEKLAAGPDDAWLTQQAKASLARLAKPMR